MGLDGQRIEVELPSGEAVTSESVRKKLQFRARMPLPAGRYEFKTVVRDGASGSVGTQQVSIDVPDFSSAASPSSLLMTTTAHAVRPESKGRKRERKAAVAEGDRGIDIGDTAFLPEAADVFVRGKPVYVLYDLYNAPEVSLAAPPGPRVFLLRDGQPMERPPFETYEVFPSRERQELRYLATLATETLEAGEYDLVVILPNGETGNSSAVQVVRRRGGGRGFVERSLIWGRGGEAAPQGAGHRGGSRPRGGRSGPPLPMGTRAVFDFVRRLLGFDWMGVTVRSASVRSCRPCPHAR